MASRRKPGRPKEAVPSELAQSALDWMSSGKPLAVWCRQKKVGRTTVYDWKAKDSEFSERFAHARNVGFDELAEGLLELVRTKVKDPLEVQRVKIEVDTTLKLLAKWDRRYSDKLPIGGDADAPPIRLTDTERAAKLAALLEGVRRRVDEAKQVDDEV